MGCAAGCGRCCDPVKLVVPPEVLEGWRDHVAAMRPDEAANTTWVLDHFTFVEIDPATGMFAYACDAYDPHTARCTMHSERPPMCQQWPDRLASGLEPTLPAQCSYQWTLPVEQRGPLSGRLLPIEPVASAVVPRGDGRCGTAAGEHDERGSVAVGS